MSPSTLSADELRAALEPAWSRVEVVAETGSTNADLLADTQAPDRSVLVAERQTAGRGRLDRTWTAPPGASLTFSVLLRPAVPVVAWGWLPLLAGVALCDAVTAQTGRQVGLKWPNDLLADPVPDARAGKLAGILAQTSAPANDNAVVIGIGLNVSTAADELPVPTATSLVLCGSPGDPEPDRAGLLVAILRRLATLLDEWTVTGGDAEACGLASAYRAACRTLGQSVSVTALTGRAVTGTAVAIDETGRLVVDTGSGTTAIGAGDVEHLRGA